MNSKKTSLILLLVIFCTRIQAQNDSLKTTKPFSFHVLYIGDVVVNFDGGIKTGATYLGLINANVHFDTKSSKWWEGGEAYIDIANTHGGKPSEELVGDFQGVSNIEAGNQTFLYELWYKQNFRKLHFIIGLQDLNTNFSVSEYGALFTNSSFGIQSSMADNIPIPIFPLTALGAIAQYNISDYVFFQAGIFDGTPDDFESNPYNINWKLSSQQGYLAVSEFQLIKSLLKGQKGTYKFGFYFHEHNDTINLEQRNGGFYFVGDQQINNHLALFSQIGLSPKTLNLHNHYLSIGLNYTGLIIQRPIDQIGFAVAFAGIDGNSIGSETTLELTYRFHLNKWMYVRPDIQYVINPAGTKAKLRNAIVGFVRVGLML